jgi:hypothetical protein
MRGPDNTTPHAVPGTRRSIRKVLTTKYYGPLEALPVTLPTLRVRVRARACTCTPTGKASRVLVGVL